MNRMMKVCALVLVSANLFQAAAFAQARGGLNRSRPFQQQMQEFYNQMPEDQRNALERGRTMEQLNPNDPEASSRYWNMYHDTFPQQQGNSWSPQQVSNWSPQSQSESWRTVPPQTDNWNSSSPVQTESWSSQGDGWSSY